MIAARLDHLIRVPSGYGERVGRARSRADQGWRNTSCPSLTGTDRLWTHCCSPDEHKVLVAGRVLSTAKCRGTGRMTCSKPTRDLPSTTSGQGTARDQSITPGVVVPPGGVRHQQGRLLGHSTWKHSASPCNRKPFSSWLAGESRSMLLDYNSMSILI